MIVGRQMSSNKHRLAMPISVCVCVYMPEINMQLLSLFLSVCLKNLSLNVRMTKIQEIQSLGENGQAT